jgi:hypothetical protein
MTDEFHRWCDWVTQVAQNLKKLPQEFPDPGRRREYIDSKRQEMGDAIEDAWRRGAVGEVLDLKYYADKLWQEWVLLEPAMAA